MRSSTTIGGELPVTALEGAMVTQHVPPRWDHQQAAVDRINGGSAFGLFFDMGTGKSRVVVEVVRERRHRTVLILAPKSACAVWPREFTKYFDPKLWTGDGILLLNKGAVKAKMEAAKAFLEARDISKRGAVVVINYESAWREPMRHFLLKRQWDLVVLDESHKIKAPGGKASMFCSLLRDRARNRLCLTGTPLPHSPLDAYAQYRFLDPSIFGSNYNRFKMNYAVWGGYEGREVVHWINQDILASKMYSIALRVESDDVLDLPPVTDDDRVVDLEPASRKAYDNLESRFITEVEQGNVTASNVLVKLLRLSQVANGYVKVDHTGEEHQVGTEKQDALEDLLDGIGKEPCVVFCRFTHDLRMVEAVCAKLKLGYRELSGRRSEWEAWQYDKEGQVIGVQLQAGGAGVDLTRARYCVFVSTSYSLGDYEQCRKRVHRPGQDRHTFYYHLVARGTVDETIRAALQDRREVVDAVMDWARSKR
jgi:SNF2 family DNA or RNA helicase